LVYDNVSLYFAFPRLSDGSVYAHLGGMFAGLLLTIWFFWNQKKTFLKKE
jgi:membrane associated rhomboid family serine protease